MRSKTHPRIKPITASWSSSHPITERGSARPHAVIQWEKRRLSQPTHTTSKEASSSGDVSDVTILSELGLAPRVAPSKQVLASVCYICILSPPGKFSRPFDSWSWQVWGRRSITWSLQGVFLIIIPLLFLFKTFTKHVEETEIWFKIT